MTRFVRDVNYVQRCVVLINSNVYSCKKKKKKPWIFVVSLIFFPFAFQYIIVYKDVTQAVRNKFRLLYVLYTREPFVRFFSLLRYIYLFHEQKSRRVVYKM